MRNFLTKPDEIDRSCFLPSDGEETATQEDFDFMQRVVDANGSKLVCVVDAEGEHICIAPEAVARYIAELINKDDHKIYGPPAKFNSKDYGVIKIESKKE